MRGMALTTSLLTHDLAYRVQQMPDAEAGKWADRFIRAFAADAQFFTNTEYVFGVSSYGWTPLTPSTFDAGVLGIDANAIGILVVQDED